MRAASHLAHLILRSAASYTLCLSELGELVGGATFRLVHCAKKRVLILEVLLLAVDPRPGVCGRGHATRLCNYMKRLLSWQAELKGCQALLLTQSDFGVARHFWARQKLRALPQATLLAKALYDWEPHDNQIYAYSIPMLCWLPREKSAQPAAYCAPAHSARAQMMASDRHVLEYRHTRHTQSVRIKLCGAITLLPPIEVESAGLERSRQPAGAAAAAAAASARVPVAPELMLACGKCAKRTGKLYECVVCCAVGHLGCLAPRAGKGTDAQAAAVAEVLALAVAVQPRRASCRRCPSSPTARRRSRATAASRSSRAAAPSRARGRRRRRASRATSSSASSASRPPSGAPRSPRRPTRSERGRCLCHNTETCGRVSERPRSKRIRFL